MRAVVRLPVRNFDTCPMALQSPRLILLATCEGHWPASDGGLGSGLGWGGHPGGSDFP